MTTDLELHKPKGNIVGFDGEALPTMLTLAEQLCDTDFVPKGLRGNKGATLACLMTGQELGLPPMASFRGIHVIDGKPGMSAELMRSLILAQGHEIWADEMSSQRVTMSARRKSTDRVSTLTWTMDDAKTAGLAFKDNWKKDARSMLVARCTSGLARLVFPDVLMGVSYTPDELVDIAADDWSEPTVVNSDGGPVAQEPKTQKRKSTRTKPATSTRRGAPAPTPKPSMDDDLDDEIEEAEIVEDDPQPVSTEDPNIAQRARTIAMEANKRGFDHHNVIDAVTEGQKSSAKEITADEGAKVMQALIDLSAGRAWLDEASDGSWVLLDYDPNPAPESESEAVSSEEDDPEEWNAERWREVIRGSNTKIVPAMKHATTLSGQVRSLEHVAGSGVARKLLEWVQSQ